ncbi:MAG: Nmad3 family putative nucleotide modification protein [Chloroflexota bacterium]
MSGELPSGRVFLANVGVNASHRLVSPLLADGRFTLVTIPEDQRLEGPSLVRYGDLPHLRAAVPEGCWHLATHYDPEFETLTYGDNCGRAARAAALKACRPGDFIFFLARLVGAAGPLFALVGFLAVEAVLPDVRGRPDKASLARFKSNAHVRRALADGRYWDGFWVFAGGPASRLFRRPVPIGREEASLLLRNATGAAWVWPAHRSELQVIGSYTRTCRCIIDPAADPDRAAAFWAAVAGPGQLGATAQCQTGWSSIQP